jgi:Ca-activated chloride channel homolog
VDLIALLLLFLQDAPVFKSNVSLVRVDAEVSDSTRTLDGLTKDDFRVFDNGTEQAITHFSQDQEPLDIVLLFDTSGSMRPKVEQVSAAATQALAQLRAGDRVAVWTFTQRSVVLAPFTDDLKAVETTLRVVLLNWPFGGGTHIQTAVDDVAEFLIREPRTERRRAVLVLTDDFGQKTRREKTVVEHYWEADAVLSELIIRGQGLTLGRAIDTVAIATPGGAISHFLMNGTVSHIADKTGGEVLKANDTSADFPQMMQRIRRRYSLYYALPAGKPGEQREVRIELTDAAKLRMPGAHVRARKGYLRPPA